MEIIKIQKNDAGQRLDKFLSKALANLPPSLMYKYIRTKKIKVNRARTQQNYILCEGDEIFLFIREEFIQKSEDNTPNLKHINAKLDVVYEDENIILCNKRPGLLVHEDEGDNNNTLITHIKAYLYRKGEYDPQEEQSFAPALCNRIDRNTGGIVIAAKNAQALREMNEKIKNDELSKFYLCAVHGKMTIPHNTLRAYLKKDSRNNLVAISNSEKPGYKNIITKYSVLAENKNSSLLEVNLVTGRTHQIRAHLAHIGHPLMGDGKYGVNKFDKMQGYRYQALYSYRLVFKFKNKDGLLGYLDGKTLSVKPEEIWFLRDYPYVAEKIRTKI